MSLYIPKMSDTPAITIPGLADNFGLLAGSQIVEQGSNENGEYIRWENGLQICWARTEFKVDTGDVTEKPFPAAFSPDYPVGAGWSMSDGSIMYSTASTQTQLRGMADSIFVNAAGADGSGGGYGNNKWSIRANKTVNTTRGIYISLFAIGRWK